MDDELCTLTRDLAKPGPVDAPELDRVGDELGIRWPVDYRDFMTSSGGGEGWVGPGYLSLWAVDDLVASNRAAVGDFASNLVGIGTDGGGELFAFDRTVDPPLLVMVPLVGLNDPVGLRSFTDLLRRLAADDMFGSRGTQRTPDPRRPVG